MRRGGCLWLGLMLMPVSVWAQEDDDVGASEHSLAKGVHSVGINPLVADGDTSIGWKRFVQDGKALYWSFSYYSSDLDSNKDSKLRYSGPTLGSDGEIKNI